MTEHNATDLKLTDKENHALQTKLMPPSLTTYSQADLSQGLASGQLTQGQLSQDVAASKSYWTEPANPLLVAAYYRLLMPLKGAGDIPAGELRHIIGTFVKDAARNGLSQGELEEGHEVYRDHGGPFLPRTFGDWRAAQDGRVFLSGKDRHARYAQTANQLRQDSTRRQEPDGGSVDLHDMEARDGDAAALFHLARRHSARAAYDLRKLPCIKDDLNRQLRKVKLVAVGQRTVQERDAIDYAELNVNKKRKHEWEASA